MPDRDIRKIINSTAPSLNTDGSVSRSIPEGSTNFVLSNNRQLAMFKKHKGRLWKTYLTKDGNQYVDKTLKTNTLEYTHKFIDYRVFKHSFTDDLPGSKIYAPWQGTGEQTALLESRSGYLTPFNMTCNKIFFRTPAMDTGATDIVFGIEKIDSGDTTVDSICTFDATSTWSDNTNFTISQLDWSANPEVEAGDLVGISLQADNTNIVTSEKHFHMTSLWKVEVVI